MFVPLALPLTGIAPVGRQRWDVGATVARALDLAEIERKAAADLMGIHEDALSRQLAGRYCDHVTLDALSCLPLEFWIHFCCLVLTHYGLLPGTRDLASRALLGGLRMARATLHGKDERCDRHRVGA